MAVTKVNGNGGMGIRMPTQAQLISTYKSIVDAAVRGGKLKTMKTPPKDAEKYAHYDITPKGLMGSHSEVYVIKGQLYLKQNAVVPHAVAHWSKVGPAPMF